MCGVAAVYGCKNAASKIRDMLESQQQRGQASAGIVSSNGEQLYSYVGMGRVDEVFSHREILNNLPGDAAVGHNRYPTTGSATLNNAQPFIVKTSVHGPLAIVHNGNLVNTATLKDALQNMGVCFTSTTDTEALLHLIAEERRVDFIPCCAQALAQAEGAYSLSLLRPNELVAVRDPRGFWPLSWGRVDGGYAVASETYALKPIGFSDPRPVAPRQIMSFSPKGVKSYIPFATVTPTPCIFELVYFSHQHSEVSGHVVWEVREQFGRQLAREAPVRADIVVPVYNSGFCAALGFSKESGIPLERGLDRNPHIGRTFIEPEQRGERVIMKFTARPDIVRGKSVAVVDDSVVRGTTMPRLVKLLRRAGAREVHVRIGAAPIRYPCYFGISTPTQEELVAAGRSIEEVRHLVGADSFDYLAYESMVRLARSGGQDSFCSACFTGEYPISITSIRTAGCSISCNDQG